MYIKTVKKAGKEYKYYYHNIKQKGRVKNILSQSMQLQVEGEKR